jgi:hypothetical protein
MDQYKLLRDDLRDGQSGSGAFRRDRYQDLKLFFRRDRDRDEIFFLTGTKNDWSRSSLDDLLVIYNVDENYLPF